jgi:DNA polymerase
MSGNILLDRALAEIQNRLQRLAESGCRGFDCSRKSLMKIENWGQPSLNTAESLDVVRTDLENCRRCKLAHGRNRIVFGDGNPAARLMFVGEGPGFEEDRQGKPFVGAAGQLLTRIIEAIKLSRDQVYICNIIKCRPPGNRNPESDEIESCFPFLERQIDFIRPDFICALGTVAAQTLLNVTTPISGLRGRFHDYKGIRVLPTYHPAYLLRNPEKKRAVWEDMKILMREYRYED